MTNYTMVTPKSAPLHPKSHSSLISCGGNFSTMPRSRHRSPKRSKCISMECEVESEGSGLESLETNEEISVLQWKVDDLAAQLTLIAHAIFRELLPLDLASLKWYDPRMKNQPESQRVNAVTSRFNYDGQWTISEILKYQSVRQRAEVLSHFIRVAERLFQLNNFHTSFAIYSAILSTPISRLKNTFALLSRRDEDIMENLAARFSSDNNWKAFRDYQESAGYPRLPHIGFYKTDLVHAYHAVTNISERHRRLKAIESRVYDLFSRSNYGFLEEMPVLQKYLRSLRYLEELQKFVDESNMKLSRALEPDAGDPAAGDVSAICRPLRDALGGTPSSGKAVRTNLIDDSSIEELMRDDAYLLSSGSSLGRMKGVGNLSLPSNIAILHRHYEWQGILEKKTMVKNGRFQFLPRWKTVWTAVWGSNLFTFKPKSPFRTSERSNFDGIPSAVYSVTDWKLQPESDELMEFKLQAPDHVFIMRFRAHTVTEFREWVKYLRSACGGTSNLINFDG